MKAKRNAFIPEPRIITLLRSVRDPNLKRDGLHMKPDIAGAELDSILDRWHKHEDMRELIELLVGENSGRGPRRKRTVAARDWNIANAIVNAAAHGQRRPLKWVADAYSIDDKLVQRAWKEHRDSLLDTWRKLSKHPDWTGYASEIITALATLDPSSRRLTNRQR